MKKVFLGIFMVLIIILSACTSQDMYQETIKGDPKTGNLFYNNMKYVRVDVGRIEFKGMNATGKEIGKSDYGFVGNIKYGSCYVYNSSIGDGNVLLIDDNNVVFCRQDLIEDFLGYYVNLDNYTKFYMHVWSGEMDSVDYSPFIFLSKLDHLERDILLDDFSFESESRIIPDDPIGVTQDEDVVLIDLYMTDLEENASVRIGDLYLDDGSLYFDNYVGHLIEIKGDLKEKILTSVKDPQK